MKLRIHLSIMQPAGYLHSLGFLDQARYVRYQMRRLGAEVSIGKNRLREDSVNIIFGAHLGFPAELKQRYTCVFFNLEQLGEGGAPVSRDYLNLLASSAVLDYDERNLAAYGCRPGAVPVMPFLAAPYLVREDNLAIEDRPIDLLFFGSMNERRSAMIDRIEACGWRVALFDRPLYGEERDHFIRQSKAIFNCHFYETSRFEQARAFHALSLGTPVVSERTVRTRPPAAFEQAVTWLVDGRLETFFQKEFMSSAWLADAERQLKHFATRDPLAHWQVAHEYCRAIFEMGPCVPPKVWQPTRIRLSMGDEDGYLPGWLNISAKAAAQPDLVLDFSQPLRLPLRALTCGGGRVLMEGHSVETMALKLDVVQLRRGQQLMRNCLDLLQPDGRLALELEFPAGMTADLASRTEVNVFWAEVAWTSLAFKPWQLGGGNSKFELVDMTFVDGQSQACSASIARGMRMEWVKTETTPHERCMNRVSRPDFGGVPEDAVAWEFPEEPAQMRLSGDLNTESHEAASHE